MKLVALAVTLVVERDQDAAVQERAAREGAAPAMSKLKTVVSEDFGVRLEGDLGAAALCRAGRLELAGRRAALVALLVDLSVAPDFEIERFPTGR